MIPCFNTLRSCYLTGIVLAQSFSHEIMLLHSEENGREHIKYSPKSPHIYATSSLDKLHFEFLSVRMTSAGAN
jgi:hypothetical protein